MSVRAAGDKIVLTLPEKGEERCLPFTASQVYEFAFTPDEVLFDKQNADLNIAGENKGNLLLEGFFIPKLNEQGFFLTQDGYALDFQDVRQALDLTDDDILIGPNTDSATDSSFFESDDLIQSRSVLSWTDLFDGESTLPVSLSNPAVFYSSAACPAVGFVMLPGILVSAQVDLSADFVFWQCFFA